MHFAGSQSFEAQSPAQLASPSFEPSCRPPPHKRAPLLKQIKSKSRVEASLRHSRTENLRPEEATLCPLDDLLVDGLRRVVHDHGTGLVIDLRVNACIPDEVDNPLLTLVLRESETG